MDHLKRLFTRDKTIQPGLCFVLMQFGGRFDQLYDSIIKPTVEAQGLTCLRADEIYTDKSIVSDIWDSIQRAEIIIADITGKNPNVLYELGLAHSLWRKTILITQNMSDVPFDLRQLRIITYSDKIGAEKELSLELRVALSALLKTETNDPTIALQSEFAKNHIYCSKNIRDSKYNLSFFIKRTFRLLILAGPNLYGVLNNDDYRKGLIDLLQKGIRVQLFLGDRKSLRTFGSIAEKDLEKSTRTILSLKGEIHPDFQNNLKVSFHSGASTLSATISDPEDDHGILTFTPRWLTDYNPNERLFCVLEKSKHPDLFSVIYSETLMLNLSNALTLEKMIKDFDENPPK